MQKVASNSTMDEAQDTALDLRQLAGRIGAQVSGIRLSGDLPDQTVAAIRAALVRHKVLFFRGQQHLKIEDQEAFARRFGPLQGHPFSAMSKASAYEVRIDSASGERTNTWHTDMTFLDAYPMASVLFGEVIPPLGGDTLWANTAAAYANMPADLRALADNLSAVHTNSYDYASERLEVTTERTLKAVASAPLLEAWHPVVRVHPESGERSLLLGTFVSHIAGYGILDSRQIYDLLMRHMTRPENSIRWTWQQGDVAMWDNRSTLHYGVNDYGDQRRILRRVTIAGDVPVGVDGRTSHMTTRKVH